jgi:hypothetical protein
MVCNPQQWPSQTPWLRSFAQTLNDWPSEH